MSKILKSKAWVGVLLVIIILVICFTFKLRTEWWCFFDVFFAFLMAFMHLMALMLQRMSVIAARKLDRIALICCIMMILSLITEFILLQLL